MPDDRQQRGDCIYRSGKPDPPNHRAGYRVTDMKEEDVETGEEEKEGKVTV